MGTSLGIVISASPCIFLLECYITAPGALFCQFRESGHYGQYFPFTVAFKMGHRCCTCVVYLLLWVGDSLFIAVYLTSDHVHVVIQGDAPRKCHFDSFLTIVCCVFFVSPPLSQLSTFQKGDFHSQLLLLHPHAALVPGEVVIEHNNS